jgi:hypothetical protein
VVGGVTSSALGSAVELWMEVAIYFRHAFAAFGMIVEQLGRGQSR